MNLVFGESTVLILRLKEWLALRCLMQAALFGLMCLSWTGVHAGPFGLESGMTLVQLGRLEGFAQTDRSGWFTARQTPLHHPEFERYDFLIDPALGLCKVVATGRTIQSDHAGQALKSRFRNLEASLQYRYGSPSSSYDVFRFPSVWKDPADWMMGLYSGARSLSTFWTDEKRMSRFHLQAIQLEARAISPSSGWIYLIYEFQNSDSCLDASSAVRHL